jgi:hypothetical protein
MIRNTAGLIQVMRMSSIKMIGGAERKSNLMESLDLPIDRNCHSQ